MLSLVIPNVGVLIVPMKNGVWRSQILWLFLIHYELLENQKMVVHSVLG